MDTILALREKRKNLWESAKNFLDTVRDENGMVSAEDAARYDKMEEDVVNLGKEIDRLERQQRMDGKWRSLPPFPLQNSRGFPRPKMRRKAVHPTPTRRPSGTASGIKILLMCRMP